MRRVYRASSTCLVWNQTITLPAISSATLAIHFRLTAEFVSILLSMSNHSFTGVIFLDPEGGSQNANLAVVVVVVVVVVISSLKTPKAFIIRSAAQWNFAYTFMLTSPTDLPSQIFKLIFNQWVISKVFSCYRFKNWLWNFTNTASACSLPAARCPLVGGGANWYSLVMNIYAQAGLNVSTY